MRYTNLKQKAVDFFSEAGFVSRIHSEDEYEQAICLMEELIEDYGKYLPLIEVLSVSIEKWEDESEDFSKFNKRIEALDDGVAVLKTLMDQYELKADDLKSELGSKSLVSMILSGSRNLTRDHIQALSHRFNISPSVFFSGA